MEQELIHKEELLMFRPKTSFTIICNGCVVSVTIDSITHISRFGRETIIYTEYRQYKTDHSISDLMKDLPVNEFFRIHSYHIVALKHMNGVMKGKIVVDEYWLPVSESYKMELIKSLEILLNSHYLFFEKP